MDSYIYKIRNPSAFKDIVCYRCLDTTILESGFMTYDYFIITAILLLLITYNMTN